VGEVINLGNPKELTLSEAIEIFEHVAGAKLVKEKRTNLVDDPQRRCPDIGKAKKLLGWEPKIDFATGIKKTLDYYAEK